MKRAIEVLQEELRGLEKSLPGECPPGSVGERREPVIRAIMAELNLAILHLQGEHIHQYAHLIECTLATYEWMVLRSKSTQPKGQMRRHEGIIKTAIMSLHPQLVLALLRTKGGGMRRLPTRLLTILEYIDTLGLDKGIQEYFDRAKQNA